MTKEPAPRPMETNNLIAPQYMPLEENFLQSGLGAIPGETESEKIYLEEDFGENYPAGKGCIPG